MKNFEKYKTAEERAKEFEKFCHKNSGLTDCRECPLESLMPDCGDSRAQFAWLDLEAEKEKPLPCPFCGSQTDVCSSDIVKHYTVECTSSGCWYMSGGMNDRESAIAAHNRVAKAVMESKKVK